jgi:hypothetical protein
MALRFFNTYSRAQIVMLSEAKHLTVWQMISEGSVPFELLRDSSLRSE